MKIDMSNRCKFAVLDILTKKANAEINAARKRGEEIHFTMTGRLQETDWSNWDGTSIEQSAEVTSLEIEFIEGTA